MWGKNNLVLIEEEENKLCLQMFKHTNWFKKSISVNKPTCQGKNQKHIAVE